MIPTTWEYRPSGTGTGTTRSVIPSRSIRIGTGPAGLSGSGFFLFLSAFFGAGFSDDFFCSGCAGGSGGFGVAPPIPLGLGTKGDGSSLLSVTRYGLIARGKPRSK